MWLSKAVDSLNRILAPVSRVIHSVGVGIIAAMMLLTVADVLLRSMRQGLVFSFEITEFMMATMVAFCLAYCAFTRGNIKVELLLRRFPQRIQAILSSITGLLAIGVYSLVVWQEFIHMHLLRTGHVHSTVLLMPTFPFAGLVAIGFVFLVLVLVRDFLESLSGAVRR